MLAVRYPHIRHVRNNMSSRLSVIVTPIIVAVQANSRPRVVRYSIVDRPIND
jgi:hypothetical protein